MFLQTYKTLKEDRETLDEDEEMISPVQITTLFVDWTDPNKLRTIVYVVNLYNLLLPNTYDKHC